MLIDGTVCLSVDCCSDCFKHCSWQETELDFTSCPLTKLINSLLPSTPQSDVLQVCVLHLLWSVCVCVFTLLALFLTWSVYISELKPCALFYPYRGVRTIYKALLAGNLVTKGRRSHSCVPLQGVMVWNRQGGFWSCDLLV